MAAISDSRRFLLSRYALSALEVLAVTGISGCVSADKYRAASDDIPRAILFNAPFSAVFPPMTLNAVITYRGPGSWKLEALWDEYLVTIRNPGEQPLMITSATLVDFAGKPREPGSDPWELEELTRQLCRDYDRAGIAFAKEGANAALYVGGIAGGAALFASTVSTGGVTVTVMQGPLMLFTVPTYIIARSIENHDSRADIEAEFNLRRFKLPLKLAPGQTRLGSFFFPMVPNPQRLRVHWKRGEEEGDADVSLEFLRGIHTPARKM